MGYRRSPLNRSRVVAVSAVAASVTIAAATWVAPPLLRRFDASGPAGTAERLVWHLGFFVILFSLVALFARAQRAARPGLSEIIPPLLLLLITLLVRLPFWHQAEVGDEGSFVVMGQDVLDGNLPYTRIWDTKPPGAYLAFVPIVLLGHTMWTVRLAGTVLVALSAWLLSRARHPDRPALWGPLLLIIAVSAIVEGQATLTEHVVLVPLAAMLTIAGAAQPGIRHYFVIGVLIGVATMVRTNLAVLAIGAIALVWLPRGRPRHGRIASTAAVIAGASAPLALTGLIYIAMADIETLWRGMITAPLALQYVGVTPMPQSLGRFAVQIGRQLTGEGAALWLAAGAGCYIFRPRLEVTTAAAFFICVCLSILAMSAASPRYLIMAFPFVAFPAGLYLDRLTADHRWHRATPLLIACAVALPLLGTPGQYHELARRIHHGEPVYAEHVHAIAKFLESRHAAGQYVYSVSTTQLAPWLAGARHAGRFADPAQAEDPRMVQVFAGPGTTVDDELVAPFARRPRFVVIARGERYPSIHTHLSRDYGPPVPFGPYDVYERRAD